MQLFRSLLPGLLLAAALSLSAGSVDVSWAVVPQAPSGAFLEQEPLRFTLREGFQKACRFQVSDVYGKTVSEGEWPDGGKGTLTLSGLPRGYYTIHLSAPGSDYVDCATFGVVSRPRRPTPGMPYALDSAHSWCAEANPKNVRFPGRGMDRVIELAHRSGVGFVRDRWGWGSIEPKPTIRGRYWHFVENAQKLAVHGIKTSVVYHDAPQWTKDTVSDLPTDLVANYNFAFKSAADTRGCVGAWEFWNEEDAGFTNEPAWEYAAQLKAAALGYRNGNPDATVLNGAFCVVPWRKFTYAALENDILPYIDALNVHTYNPLKKYDEWNAEVRKLLEQYGRPDMPVWITESSTNSPRDARRKSYMPGLFTYSPSQEAVIAEFVPKAQILMQAAGIEKDFFFVLSPYNEGYSDWGLLRKDYSARPGYFSFATLVHELGDAKSGPAVSMTVTGPDGGRRLYIGFANGAIALADTSDFSLDMHSADIGRVRYTFPDPEGLLWIVTDRTGITSWNESKRTFRHYEHSRNVMSYYADTLARVLEQDGRMWIKMNNYGFGYYDRESDSIIPLNNVKEQPDCRFMNGVACYTVDDSGVLWFSTARRGLERATVITPKVEVVVPPSESSDEVSASEIRAVLTDSRGRVWVAAKAVNFICMLLTSLHV